jgi:hypothetical protein
VSTAQLTRLHRSALMPSFLDLMSHNTKIGIVTAAGYTEAERYYGRLHGLLEAIKVSEILTPSQKQNLVIMGKPYLCHTPNLTTVNCDSRQAVNQISFSLTPLTPHSYSPISHAVAGSSPACPPGRNQP